MVANREVVLPGVGVYDPRQRRLEGEVSRIRGLNIKQSVERLTINIHCPEDLMDALSSPKMGALRECSVNYVKLYSFGSLKRALDVAAFNPDRLKTFSVTGPNCVVQPWHVETLRAMHRCLSGANLFLSGLVSTRPVREERDEVVTTGTPDEWFRHYGNTAALYSINLPWCEWEIRERQPSELIVDCDDQFHMPALTGGILTDGSLGIMKLQLHNVTTLSSYFLSFLEQLALPNLKELRLSSNDPLMESRWIKAITVFVRTKTNLRGVRLFLNGNRCA